MTRGVAVLGAGSIFCELSTARTPRVANVPWSECTRHSATPHSEVLFRFDMWDAVLKEYVKDIVWEVTDTTVTICSGRFAPADMYTVLKTHAPRHLVQ